MRVSAAAKEKFRQRNYRDAGWADALSSLGVGGAGSGGQYPGVSERLLQSNRRGACKHVASPRTSFPSEGVIGGVLCDGAPEVGLRAEVTGRREGIQREVRAFRTFQWVSAFVANVSKAGAAHARRQRQY